MKALAKLRPEPGIWLADVPEPEVGHNDILIKIHKALDHQVFVFGYEQFYLIKELRKSFIVAPLAFF